MDCAQNLTICIQKSCSCWIQLSDFLAEENEGEDDNDSGLGDSPPPTPPAALDVVLGNPTMASASSNSTPRQIFKDRSQFNFSLTTSSNSSRISSPSLTHRFRPPISSAMPAIQDDETLDLDDLTIGDDDVLVMKTELNQEPVRHVWSSSIDNADLENQEKPSKPQIQAKSKFFMRFWSWFHQRYKLHRANSQRRRVRRKSTEVHSKRVLTTNFNDITESERVKGQVILNKWQRVKSSETLAKSSWADVCTSLDRRRHHPIRRSSHQTNQQTRPERHRTCSLVAGNQSNLLHPHTGIPLSDSRREVSLESGYQSHDSFVVSRISSPENFRKKLKSQSICYGDEHNLILSERTKNSALEKRKKFRMKSIFHEEVIEDEDAEDILGEWAIKPEELYFGKRIVNEKTHSIYNGKWHGDVIIHSFKISDSDPKSSVESYYEKVKALMHIRHENIVSFMGAASNLLLPFDEQLKSYLIVTNPVRAESLYAKSDQLDQIQLAKKMSIAYQVANAVGYLHSKDIIHGRICSRNIFLEPKVQLSLLDYAVGHSNIQYSSPQMLSQECCRPSKSDDVFAFGTLIFELFGGQWTGQMLNKHHFLAAGAMAKQLEKFPCTEKLKRIIQSCWNYEPQGRTPIHQLIHHFQPGSCLVRRHSISEPRLDQIGNSKI